jgi:hypothetical protein
MRSSLNHQARAALRSRPQGARPEFNSCHHDKAAVAMLRPTPPAPGCSLHNAVLWRDAVFLRWCAAADAKAKI